jgi:hypothetical protein
MVLLVDLADGELESECCISSGAWRLRRLAVHGSLRRMRRSFDFDAGHDERPDSLGIVADDGRRDVIGVAILARPVGGEPHATDGAGQGYRAVRIHFDELLQDALVGARSVVEIMRGQIALAHGFRQSVCEHARG